MDVADKAVVADPIVVDISADILDETVVADLDVAEGGIADAAMLLEPWGYLDATLVATKGDMTIELDVVNVLGIEVVGDL